MYKNILLFIISLLFLQDIYAQDWNEIYYLESEAHYLIEERQYLKAIDMFQRMLREIPEYSLAKYRIGQLYLQTDDQKEKAIKFLEEASEDIALDFDEKSLRETRAPVNVLLYLGEAYQTFYRIDEAITTYNRLKDLIKPDDELYSTVTHRLETCENAKLAFQNPLRVSKRNLGEPLNDDNPNISAVFSGDGNTVIFTSYTRNYIDNYYSVKENGVWSTPKKISEKLSTKYYLKTSSLSYDGTQLYVVTDDSEENDIFVCFREGRTWTNADKLHKTINGRKSNETHACISKDGNTIYFTSNREGGLGGMDIYKSTLDEKGRWNDPENLGPSINTPYDEATPFLTLDDKYLFFSSQGHSSIGGFDVFYIDLDSKSMAINLGYPANTTGDDLFFVPDNSLTSGYISMYDSTSLGKRDIYHISILPKINLAGNITDPEGNQITNSELQISLIEADSEANIKDLNTSNGQFDTEINPGKYTVSISGENFESFTDQIEIPENYSQSSFVYNATLNPIEIEQEELVAEVVEETISEPETEETEAVEEIKEEEVIEEEKPEPVEEIVEEQPEPEKEEVVKYVPKTTVTSGKKTYSVQLMALKNPVKVDYFKEVDHVVLTQYPDGFYRYTVGNTESYTEAQKLKEEIHQKGYKDAFIRINDEGKSTYTIQIMALIIPVKPDYFKDLSSVVVTKGADDYFRYTVGDYASYEEAKNDLPNIKSLGYSQAYVKKTNN
jgi:hypothetical protein